MTKKKKQIFVPKIPEKPKNPLHCECGRVMWEDNQGSRVQCSNCERIYEDRKLLWDGPSERLYNRMYRPAVGHFERIHRDMYRLERKFVRLEGILNARKKKKKKIKS